MDQFAIFIIVALVIVIAVLLIKQNKEKLSELFGRKNNSDNTSPYSDNTEANHTPAKANFPFKVPHLGDLKGIFEGIGADLGKKRGGTIILGRGTLEQLDSASGRVIAEFKIEQTDKPICISKPGAGKGSYIDRITIVKNSPATDTMSSNAYYICTDPDDHSLTLEYADSIVSSRGCLRDTANGNRPINPIFFYHYDKNEIIELSDAQQALPLINGLIFCLGGQQWFRFLEPQTAGIDPRVLFKGGVNEAFVNHSEPEEYEEYEEPESPSTTSVYGVKRNPQPEAPSNRRKKPSYPLTFNKEDDVNR